MIQFLSKEYYIVYMYMDNETIIKNILAMPKEELRIFIEHFISDTSVRERVMIYLILKNCG